MRIELPTGEVFAYGSVFAVGNLFLDLESAKFKFEVYGKGFQVTINTKKTYREGSATGKEAEAYRKQVIDMLMPEET